FLYRSPISTELRIETILPVGCPDKDKADWEFAFDRIGFGPIDFALVFRNVDPKNIFRVAFHDLRVADVMKFVFLPGFIGLEAEIVRQFISVMIACAKYHEQY